MLRAAALGPPQLSCASSCCAHRSVAVLAFGQRPCAPARAHNLRSSPLSPLAPSAASLLSPLPGWRSTCVSGPSARRWGIGPEGTGSAAQRSLAAAQDGDSQPFTSPGHGGEAQAGHATRTVALLTRRKQQPSGWPAYLAGKDTAPRRDDAEAAELGCVHCGRKEAQKWYHGRRVCASCTLTRHVVNGEVQLRDPSASGAWAKLTAEERAARLASITAARGLKPSGWPAHLDGLGVAPRGDAAEAAQLGCAHCGSVKTNQWYHSRRVCHACVNHLRIVDGEVQSKHQKKVRKDGWSSYLEGRGVAPRKDATEAAELGCAHCGRKETSKWHHGRRVCHACVNKLRIVDGEVQRKQPERARKDVSGWPAHLDAQGVPSRKDDAEAAELGCAHCGRKSTTRWFIGRRICAVCVNTYRIEDGEFKRTYQCRPKGRQDRSAWRAHLDAQGVPSRKDDAEAAELGCAHCGRKESRRWFYSHRVCESCTKKYRIADGKVQRR